MTQARSASSLLVACVAALWARNHVLRGGEVSPAARSDPCSARDIAGLTACCCHFASRLASPHREDPVCAAEEHILGWNYGRHTIPPSMDDRTLRQIERVVVELTLRQFGCDLRNHHHDSSPAIVCSSRHHGVGFSQTRPEHPSLAILRTSQTHHVTRGR